LLTSYTDDALVDVMTFEVVERQVIRSLRTKIVQDSLEKPQDLKPAILRRRDGHWATIQLEEYADGGNIYATTYDALDATLDLLSLRQAHDAGFSYASADAMYQAYTTDLFQFDQLYRLFHECADKVELAGWDILKDVQKVVESCYSGWYLDQLSVSWGGFLEGNDGLLQRWSISNIPRQQDFFSCQVKPILKSHPRSKVFVIISDAFRYEVAEELTRDINSKFRFKAMLSSQLGVLPSYTALGMAALLPRREYGYKGDTDQVFVDGHPCASLEQRGAILSEKDGIAVKADDLLAMSKDQGRELVRPWRVIYIYHNQIDATGDSAPTEGKTFSAARRTIEEISSLVRFIVNSLNGSNVFVTADHGFLYQDIPPTPLEKSALGGKPEGVTHAKKRYILGKGLGESEKAWRGSTSVTAGTAPSEADMEFWIPKGVNRFHFAGGARFIHGGALPQEVVVPVVQVKELEGKAAEKEAVKQVGVSLLGSNRKIVNYIQKFEFIQTEKATEKMTARTLVVSLRDGDNLISNEETVTFDSSSDSMEERKRTVKLMLKKGSYDNKKEYSLVLRDPNTQIEYERVPMTIDLAFINDF
jgi:TIGR02687 family protein